MTDTTHRLAMPLLHPGQAQKELTHNEALVLADLAIDTVVLGTRDAAPADAAIGDAWIVGDSPTGVWAGRARSIAGWTAGGWRFLAVREGATAWLAPERLPLRVVGGTWERGATRAERVVIGGVQVVGVRGAAIAAPTGGATVDGEARAAVVSILAALRTHGLIAGFP